MKDVSCTICGSDSAITVAAIADYDKPFVNVCCTRCALVYANPRPSIEDLSEYYRSQFIQGRHEIKTVEEARARAKKKGSAKKYKVEGLVERLDARSHVLEIGCSYGFLLDAIQKAVGCRVEGVEPSEVSGAFAHEEFGFPVFHGTVEDYVQRVEYADRKFDLIILYHVLEHIADPVGTLGKLEERLAENGRLYICVPDVMHLQEPPESFFQIPHIYNFSPWTLHVTLWRAGFKIIRMNRKLRPPKNGLEVFAVRADDPTDAIRHVELTVGSRVGQVLVSLRTASVVYGFLRWMKRAASKMIPRHLLESASIKLRQLVRTIGDFIGN